MSPAAACALATAASTALMAATRDGKVLVVINGAYGHRAKKICDIAGRATAVYETPEDTPPDLAKVEAILEATPAITHVFVVHCETTSGILNPIAEIGTDMTRFPTVIFQNGYVRT